MFACPTYWNRYYIKTVSTHNIIPTTLAVLVATRRREVHLKAFYIITAYGIQSKWRWGLTVSGYSVECDI